MKTTAIVGIIVVSALAACGGQTETVIGPAGGSPTNAPPITNSDQQGPPLGASLQGDGSRPKVDIPNDATGLTTLAMSKAQCDQEERCNDNGLKHVTMFHGGRDECIKHFELLNQRRNWLLGVQLTQANIDACAKRLSVSNACGSVTSYAECDFRGGARELDACNDSAQCASGNCSALDEKSCGVCLPRLEAGENCQGNVLGCDVGMFCSEVSKTCVTRTKQGDSCESQWPYGCADGLACLDGACKPLIPEGQACSSTLVGAGYYTCVRGLSCIDNVCSVPPANIKKVKAGDDCPTGDANAACSHSLCEKTSAGGSPKCRALPDDEPIDLCQ